MGNGGGLTRRTWNEHEGMSAGALKSCCETGMTGKSDASVLRLVRAFLDRNACLVELER